MYDENIEIVKNIIEQDPSIVYRYNSINATALYIACRYGQFEMVKLLVENKAEINKRDAEGITPFTEAVSSENMDIIQYLIENKADINNVDNIGQNVLFCVANKGSEKLMNFLLEQGVKFISDEDGETPYTLIETDRLMAQNDPKKQKKLLKLLSKFRIRN